MKSLKKLGLLVMALLMVCALAACGNNDSQPANNNNNNNEQGETARPISPTNNFTLAAELEVAAGEAESIAFDVAELQADPDNAILTGFDADIQAKINDWYANLGEGMNLLARAYVLDTENYLSVLLVREEYPSYGADAEVYSYVYDKIVNNVMDADFALAWTTTTDDDIVEAISEYLEANQKWRSFNVDAFYVDTDEQPVYLVTTKVSQEEAEDWVYVYVMKDGVIWGNLSGMLE